MNPSPRTVFVTGGTGFIGRRLMQALASGGMRRVIALTRGEPPAQGSGITPRGCAFVQGSLHDTPALTASLAGADVVVHLAAVTGKAPPAEYRRVNVEGTGSLLEACRRAGVRRVIFVSSIAATYGEKSHYPYARSKEEAEALVRESGTGRLIVRPTIVLGAGSPAWKGLSSLARLPLIPVFGDGLAKVQPIHVDDVAAALVALVDQDELPDAEIDLGGPDVVTMEELLRRIRAASGAGRGRIIHLPAVAAMSVLRMIEPVLLPVLPVTAGQLSSFVNDGLAQPTSFLDRRLSGMKKLDEMLRLCASDRG